MAHARQSGPQAARTGGDGEIVIGICAVGQIVERVEILKVQLEQAPAQPRPTGRGKRLGKGRRQDQRPDLVRRRHARNRDRIAERKGKAIARRAHIDPDNLGAATEIGQIGTQPPRFGQEANHRHHLPLSQQ